MTTVSHPETKLDARYSSENATATSWSIGNTMLREAPLYWLVTVRQNGQPHVTPLLGVWRDNAFHFTTGEQEQKARNLVKHTRCTVLTGVNSLDEGSDIVVEGQAERVTKEPVLRELAAEWLAKYGEAWRFEVQDGAFHSAEGGTALVFRVIPSTAFGFGKGETFSQTRWTF